MVEPTFVVPEQVTFAQAIALSQSLLSQLKADELPTIEIEAAIASLVKSETGARGFFVSYLTDRGTAADHPPTAVVHALRTAPERVAELLVKNLAMSAATALAHQRQQNEAMAQQSEQVRSRTMDLIKLVDLPDVYKQARKLWKTAAAGEGSYKAFLDRWGYDDQQRQVIRQVLAQVLLDQPD